MEATASSQRSKRPARFRGKLALPILVLLLVALPFIIALLDGQSIASLVANESGQCKFIQRLLIEVFILAIFALSYDLIFGITGLLSFGHAMFFAVGAYLTGILLKSFGWPLPTVLAALVVAAVVQALLFSLVLPRVKGVTFALVTLGIAEVFHISVQSREAAKYTGADVGLQGIPAPAYLNGSTDRLTFYFAALGILIAVYLLCRRFVDSPTGRVCVATSQNEDRALMLGYNTFYFKLAALIVSSFFAALAGMMHALSQPIVSPNIGSLQFTVNALLMVLIGGIGTLSGAPIGAALLRLMTFYFDKWFGESSGFLVGVVFVLLVLFLPYGIVGTWRLRSLQWKQGWQRLLGMLDTGKEKSAGAKRG
jgi:branched-chain amino acid transport system permease protein